MNEEKEPSALLKVKEVAQLLDVKPVTVYRMISAGKLAVTKIGTKGTTIRIDRAELEAYLRRNRA